MNNFKFNKVDNKFRWESNFMALEFSKPSIQGHSEFAHLESEEDIMYYYYTVKIFKKVTEWTGNDEEIIKWKLVGKRGTHDFPCILDLKWLVEHQLNDDTRIDGQKIEYRNGEVNYSKTMSTGGFACDDFYEISKRVDSEGNDERYVVYCGTTYDIQGDLNSAGIRTPYVYKEDIEELFKCVSSFIQYSIEENNKAVDAWADNYKIKNNKIYEYSDDKAKIESIYSVGDRVYMATVTDNKQKDYDEVKILKIEDKSITLEDGIIINECNIAYMHSNPTEEMLKYNEIEIAQDFLNILSNEEKEEFKSSNIEEVLNKYKMAIIDRTSMCRDEHNFDIDYNTGDNINAVEPIVRNVINIIKSKLTK